MRDEVAELRARYAAAGRNVPVAHLHLTLAFAGTIDAERLAALENRLGDIRTAPFELLLDRLDGFSAARVQWLGPSTSPPALEALASRLQQRCRDLGIDLPDDDFRPHVTLRRGVAAPAARRVPGVRWRVQDVVLVESGCGGKPGAYRIRQRWSLGGHAAEG